MKIPPYLSAVWQYLFSAVLIALTTLLFFSLRNFLDTTIVALLFLIPIGVITTTCGFAPGIMSALFSFFALNYFFIKPYYTLAVHRPLDLVILIIFLVVSVVLSRLVGQAQAGLAAANAREKEATQLYEISTALAGLHDESKVAQILGKQIFALSQGQNVRVNITGEQSVKFSSPQIALPDRPPELTLPIQAARSTLGEILLWRNAPPISLGETRLIQTFASQAALALERARLAKAESRAKVLEESDRLKSAILSSVSHELRTPLSTIKAAASSLRGNEVGWDSPARVELIAAIDDEADHLNMLVGNLLDMSRIESGALKPKREWNILSEIVGSVIARMKYSAEGHKIEIKIPESLPFIPMDYVQMEQVFTNLVSNSIKYAPANSIIRIHASIDLENILVQVSNQGPHIPTQHLERIFDKFYRINDADRVTGTGLGLSICKGIIEAHGGHIWAENLSNGLAFNFTLPLTWEGVLPPELPMDTEVE
jgi:two-component system sensor histidine kinase KdpD